MSNPRSEFRLVVETPLGGGDSRVHRQEIALYHEESARVLAQAFREVDFGDKTVVIEARAVTDWLSMDEYDRERRGGA